MQSSENHLSGSTLSKSDYAITLQIPSFKKVKYQEQYKAYRLFSHEKQKSILVDAFHLWSNFYKDEETYIEPEVYFEEHQDKRLHAHTYLKNVSRMQILEIQKSYCQNFGMSPKQFNQVFDFFIPDNFNNWLAYCQKGNLNDLDKDLILLNLKNNID